MGHLFTFPFAPTVGEYLCSVSVQGVEILLCYRKDREIREVREDHAYGSKLSLFFAVFAVFATFAVKRKSMLSS